MTVPAIPVHLENPRIASLRNRSCVIGCVEALAEERALLLCYWLVHRPPGPTPLLLALRLLHALAITPPAAWAAAAQGGVVYLLTLLLPATPPAADFKV